MIEGKQTIKATRLNGTVLLDQWEKRGIDSGIIW